MAQSSHALIQVRIFCLNDSLFILPSILLYILCKLSNTLAKIFSNLNFKKILNKNMKLVFPYHCKRYLCNIPQKNSPKKTFLFPKTVLSYSVFISAFYIINVQRI
ncbi:hypothetical protein BpHYR1_030847 [Brachionus plicatilis]|uniref:Uncharacterized protein n=1 Tax=Brachionus plicatilis TaxID=10195 RepID=A0A3M7Q2U1_BRAPC|nr:hypothetical protein BpHYR1_030847 [Brachionus plicatilis]